MSALKSSGLRLTGSAPVGSSGCAATGLAGLGSSVDGPAGLTPEGGCAHTCCAGERGCYHQRPRVSWFYHLQFLPESPVGELGKSPMKNL